MALTKAQFEMIDIGQSSIDNREWKKFESIHSLLKTAHFTEKTYGDLSRANELADSIRTLAKQYMQYIDSFRSDNWIWSDGGRAAAGHEGEAGDCVTRAISIALNLPYQEVWEYFDALQPHTPDNGVSDRLFAEFLTEYGWHKKSCGMNVEGAAYMIDDGIIQSCLLDGHHLTAAQDSKYHDIWNSGGLQVLSFWLSPDSPYR